MPIWPRTTRRLEFLYVVTGETDHKSFPNMTLTAQGVQQIAAAASAIQNARIRPEAVMLLRAVTLDAFQQMTLQLAEDLQIPIRPCGSEGEGVSEKALEAYRKLPETRLVVPITATGMFGLLRQLDPARIASGWLTAPSASVWHTQVVCSLGDPPIQRSARLLARIT